MTSSYLRLFHPASLKISSRAKKQAEMTIDILRSEKMPIGRHPCDDLATDMEALYKERSDLRYDITLSLHLARPRSVSLVYIRTLHKRRGKASEVLNALTQSADRHGITLDLDARAIPENGARLPGLNQSNLERFYSRRGFQIIQRRDGSAIMRRLAPTFRNKSCPMKTKLNQMA